MRSLFTVLNDLMQPYQDQPEQARSALNDINTIVRIAEKHDMEIDSDQAIEIQNTGLSWLQQLQQGNSWDQAQAQAKQQLEN